MITIPYSWSIISVDTQASSFIVKYSAAAQPDVQLVLHLPQTLDAVAKVVEASAPIQVWWAATPPASGLKATDVLSLKGQATAVPASQLSPSEGAEEFKQRVCKVLFETGVTTTNVYKAPAAPV